LKLTARQIKSVWERRLEAEVCSLYYGDLARCKSKVQQILTGCSFFFASGTAATIVTKFPPFVPIALSTLVAMSTAYMMLVRLDSKIRTMAKLHYGCNQLAIDYEQLWNHHWYDDAEEQLDLLRRRDAYLSELATNDTLNNQTKLEYWQNRVRTQYATHPAPMPVDSPESDASSASSHGHVIKESLGFAEPPQGF
jgi:hypothetical protein